MKTDESLKKDCMADMDSVKFLVSSDSFTMLYWNNVTAIETNASS